MCSYSHISRVWMFVQEAWPWTFTGIWLPFLPCSGSITGGPPAIVAILLSLQRRRQGNPWASRWFSLLSWAGIWPLNCWRKSRGAHSPKPRKRHKRWSGFTTVCGRVCVWCSNRYGGKKPLESFLLSVKTQRATKDEQERTCWPSSKRWMQATQNTDIQPCRDLWAYISLDISKKLNIDHSPLWNQLKC